MTQYEYKVVAAPSRGLKAKGIKSPEARYSNALETLMNSMAKDGWEYQRAEALPSTERAGFTSTKTVLHNVLIFRRQPPVSQGSSVQLQHDDRTLDLNTSMGKTPSLSTTDDNAAINKSEPTLSQGQNIAQADETPKAPSLTATRP